MKTAADRFAARSGQTAREKMLVKEKELTRARDALAAERRRMPWMAVEKDYRFEGPDGEVSLLDLFEGRRQLIVYRAFYGPEVTTYAEGGSYPERACVGCSFVADQVAHPAHLNARDTTLAFASRAPQAEIQGLKERMGWEHIPWYTITDDFDKDFGVDEWHGHQRLHPRRRPDLPHLLHRRPRRRADGQHLELPRHDRARPPGGVGGLTRAATRRPRRTGGGTTTTPTGERVIAHVGPACQLEELLPAAGSAGRRTALRADLDNPASATPPGAQDLSDNTLRISAPSTPPPRRSSTRGPTRRCCGAGSTAEPGWETSEADVDLRVGGKVRLVMRDPAQGRRVRRRRGLHRDRPAEPPGVHLDLGPQPDAATTDRDRLRGGRRRHHGPLHP